MSPPASVPSSRTAPSPATGVPAGSAPGRQQLPDWRSVLAVVAHPDDESFGLGALLAAFVSNGTEVSVLCLTRGEASTLHGVSGDLAEVRGKELRAAADALGVSSVELHSHPDGRLCEVPVADLAAQVTSAANRVGAAGLLAFDPSGVTGHPDHQRATEAALAAAAALGLPVLGWTLPGEVADTVNAAHATSLVGHPPSRIDLAVPVDRARQYEAVHCHPSQAVPSSPLWRRLELLGDTEHLRWLHGAGTLEHTGAAEGGAERTARRDPAGGSAPATAGAEDPED